MNYIKGFDGLRAISILFVLLTHLGMYTQLPSASFLKTNFNLISGSTGVMIFFTISGFLITLLLLHEQRSFGRIQFASFFARRFLRLLPPLLLFYAGVLLLMHFNYLPERYLAVLLSFFYVYNFVPVSEYVGELGHTWSLAVEEQFYIIWPFILSVFRRIRWVVLFSVLLILICIGVKLLYKTPIYYKDTPYYLFDHFFPNRWFIPACLPIMVGSLTAIALFYKGTYLKKIVDVRFLLLFLLLFFAQLLFDGLSFVVIETLQPIAVSLILLWIYFNQDSLIVRFLEFRLFSYVGKISYGLYVYQGLFLRTGPGGDLWIQKFPFNIILVFVTAVLSYHIIEFPILNYKKRFKPVKST